VILSLACLVTYAARGRDVRPRAKKRSLFAETGSLQILTCLIEHPANTAAGDAQFAEDCAQEVFIRLYKARDTYTPDAALSTFVFRIARNLWIDAYRSRRSRPHVGSLDAPAGRASKDGNSDSPALINRVESEVGTPDMTVDHLEDQRRLRAAIEKLPEGQRAVLDLAGAQGLKYEQVSAILGIPVGTVKSRVHAAVQNLRRLMGVPAGSEE